MPTKSPPSDPLFDRLLAAVGRDAQVRLRVAVACYVTEGAVVKWIERGKLPRNRFTREAAEKQLKREKAK